MIYISLTLFLTLTYLVGSIPFGLLISKILNKKDIRQHGSKNIGATNVTRVLGKKYGFLTLILDGLKGVVMVLIAKNIFSNFSDLKSILALTAFFAVVGHIFSIYLDFKGGKGVATTIAVILTINPFMGLVNICMWLVIFFVTRISAVASILSILLVILFAIYSQADIEQIILFLSLFVLIVVRHKENIIRLKNGRENKI